MGKTNNSLDKYVNIVKNPKFAYFIGFFMADGCYYKDSRSGRFEFSDGTSIKKEITYSYQFLESIKKIVSYLLDKDIPRLRKRGNKYVLNFCSKKLEKLFERHLKFKAGPKTFSIDIPKIYKNNNLKKFFWLGVMDGDGMVARNSRKISLESGSKKLVNSFREFLENKNIKFKYSCRKMGQNIFYRVNIGSLFLKDYANEIGFYHPRKRKWLDKHLKSDFYLSNKVDIKRYVYKDNKIDYKKIFDSDRIFIINGRSIISKNSINRKNMKFIEMLGKLVKRGNSRDEIHDILSNCKWKMSKGSTNSITMPSHFNKDILTIAEFVRLRGGSVSLSRNHIKSFNINPNDIISKIEKTFDVRVKYTCKNEPIFCSGVLHCFFSKIIKNNNKVYKLPIWYSDLKC